MTGPGLGGARWGAPLRRQHLRDGPSAAPVTAADPDPGIDGDPLVRLLARREPPAVEPSGPDSTDASGVDRLLSRREER